MLNLDRQKINNNFSEVPEFFVRRTRYRVAQENVARNELESDNYWIGQNFFIGLSWNYDKTREWLNLICAR